MNILIADDEPLVRQGLSLIVKNSHIPACHIIEASSGTEAIRLAEKYEPEIAMLDIKMPGGNGFDVIRQIRKFPFQTRVIIISAYGYFDYAQQALRYGVFDYLVKPIQPDEVIQVLCRCLQEMRTARPAQRPATMEKAALKSPVEFYPREERLCDQVRLGHSQNACYQLKQILDEMENRESLPALTVRAAELLVLVTRAACEAGAPRNRVAEIVFRTLPKLSVDHAEVIHVLKDAVYQAVLLVPEEKDSGRLRIIRQAEKYVRENLDGELSLQNVAGHVYLSPAYFSSLFKQMKGQPFTQYVNKLRVDNAKELLADESLSVRYIARHSGFADASYFTRVFKNVMGMTPGEYRQRACEKQ